MATDAEIRAAGLYAVPKNKYLQNEFQLPTKEVVEEETESFGIPQTQAFTNSGGDNYTGGYNFGNTGFQNIVDARQRNLNKPTDTSTFMGRTMGTVKDFIEPQSASQIMKDGYQEPRFQPGIIGMMMGKLDNYRNLPQADQAFIAQNMGYTGPTVFGENNSGLGKDPFGINTRSAKGNYADYVDKKDLQLTNTLTKKGGKIFDKYAVDPITGQALDEEEFSYDPVTGKYIGTSASAIAKANQMNKMNLTKLGFYKNKKKESEGLRMQEKLAKEEAAAQIERATRGQAPSDPGSRGRDDTPGFGKTAEGNYSNQFEGGDPGLMADGGRAGYFFGGRVNYKIGGVVHPDGRKGFFKGAQADTSKGESMSPGTDASGGFRGGDNDGGNDNPPNFFVEDKTSIVDTSGLKSKSPEINIDYTDPKNYASLKSRIYNTNILDNDNINVDGTLSGEIGPVSYDTSFTDQGITGTNLKAGNFTTNLNPDMQVQNIGYTNNYNGIDYGAKYDNNGNLMFSAGVNFKNGGLAGLL